MGIRLMIAEDHPVIGAGVTRLIQGTEIELVCQAETSEQTVKLAPPLSPTCYYWIFNWQAATTV